MKIISYDVKKKGEILAQALVVLLSGGSVVYPTETAYAIGVDFYSPHSCANVYRIKRRSKGELLPVIVPSLQYATTLVRFSEVSMRLAQQFWPGPLTLVLPFMYYKEWPHHGSEVLAVRVSSHPFAADLARAFGRPLVSTSANVSGKRTNYNPKEILEQFKQVATQPDLLIDVGQLPETPPSTIVQEEGGKVTVLRAGAIKPDALR